MIDAVSRPADGSLTVAPLGERVVVAMIVTQNDRLGRGTMAAATHSMRQL